MAPSTVPGLAVIRLDMLIEAKTKKAMEARAKRDKVSLAEAVRRAIVAYMKK